MENKFKVDGLVYYPFYEMQGRHTAHVIEAIFIDESGRENHGKTMIRCYTYSGYQDPRGESKIKITIEAPMELFKATHGLELV